MVPTHFLRAVPQLLPVATAHCRFEKRNKRLYYKPTGTTTAQIPAFSEPAAT